MVLTVPCRYHSVGNYNYLDGLHKWHVEIHHHTYDILVVVHCNYSNENCNLYMVNHSLDKCCIRFEINVNCFQCLEMKTKLNFFKKKKQFKILFSIIFLRTRKCRLCILNILELSINHLKIRSIIWSILPTFSHKIINIWITLFWSF